MPSKNVVKSYGVDVFYHVYNRGVNKEDIFRDHDDYIVFLNLLKRFLSPKPTFDKYLRPYPNHSKLVELNCFCLMPNHFHLLLYNKNTTGVETLLRSLATSYSGYFNKKYHRVGHVFQGPFKASQISSDAYYQHISRYIHLNPLDIGFNYEAYEFSSYPYFLGMREAKWLHPARAIGDFDAKNYKEFVADFVDYKADLVEIKHELANA